MDVLEEHDLPVSDKDDGDETDLLTDEKILAPGLTIVEEEGSLGPADLGASTLPNEGAVMYRVMQVSSGGDVVELPQMVAGHQAGQFYVINTTSDVLTAASPRSIAPRNTNVQRQTGAVPQRRDDRRRVSHNEVERRRRDKINNWILKLGKIIPDTSAMDSPGKTSQSKGGILSKACDYIQELRVSNQRLAEGLQDHENLRAELQTMRQKMEEIKAENVVLRQQLDQSRQLMHS